MECTSQTRAKMRPGSSMSVQLENAQSLRGQQRQSLHKRQRKLHTEVRNEPECSAPAKEQRAGQATGG